MALGSSIVFVLVAVTKHGKVGSIELNPTLKLKQFKKNYYSAEYTIMLSPSFLTAP